MLAVPLVLSRWWLYVIQLIFFMDGFYSGL